MAPFSAAAAGECIAFPIDRVVLENTDLLVLPVGQPDRYDLSVSQHAIH
jgi:murein tripeptide amidase MpaA